MSAPPRRLRVEDSDAGRRLDVFLAERLELSRAQVRRLLARGAVRRPGSPGPLRAKGEPLAPGTWIEVEAFARPDEARPRPGAGRPLAILAEGDGWLAVDKPAGMPVHPLSEEETGTLLNALIERHPEAHGVGEGGLRSGVVHRLDVETSGALLWAWRQDAWQRLRAAFRERRVEKVYRAVALGRLTESGELSVPLALARHRPARVRVLAPEEGARSRGARPCDLRWRPLALYAGATLLEVRPRTGFLHQIRVSLAHLGHPVAGDRVYGPASDPTGARRQMLHAARVAWSEGEAESPDPEDFADLLRSLAAPPSAP